MKGKILITGSRGVIGRQLVYELSSKGYQIIGTRRPQQLSTPNQNEVILEPWKPIEIPEFDLACIVHLAASYSVSPDPIRVQDVINSNVGISTSVAELASLSNIPVIAIGSFVEKFPGEEGLSYYAASKLASKDILVQAAIQSGFALDYIYLYDTYGGVTTRGKFIDLLINLQNSETKLPASLGTQVQDLVFIDDFISGVNKLILSPKSKANQIQEWQLRTGDSYTLREIASIVAEIKGFNLNIEWGLLSSRGRDVYSLWDCAPNLIETSDMTKLRSGLEIVIKSHGFRLI